MTDLNKTEQEIRSGLSGLEHEAIIRMATAAGFSHSPPPFKHWRGTISDLERFARLVIDASARLRSNV